jgi:hypothetical protein
MRDRIEKMIEEKMIDGINFTSEAHWFTSSVA